MLIAIIAMIVACLAQHLGLSDAIAKVLAKIASCPKCLTFWFVLIVLIINQENAIVAIMLSLMCSYLSNWFGLMLLLLNQMYSEIWQKLNKK